MNSDVVVDRLLKVDPWLKPYRAALIDRQKYISAKSCEILGDNSIANFALGHLYFGLHHTAGGWVMREWAPHASQMYLHCDKNNWQDDLSYLFYPLENGVWELKLPEDKLEHLDYYKLHIFWDGGDAERIPAYAEYVLQDEKTKLFAATVWNPTKKYNWRHVAPIKPQQQLIYEAHIGMSGEDEQVATYQDFIDNVLPRVKQLGYNTVQLMAIQEHPYYGSFGYQVANFFAESSRFGTPADLKHLVDEAHGMGLRVVMDVVHSHSVKNENEGLSNFAGDPNQYFKPGLHEAWNSRLFDYSKPEVVHFLLSNLRYFMDEYRFDGFRFDGVTSMIYHNHGLNQSFTSYKDYFTDNTYLDALTYLSMANTLVHEVNSNAITIAEDMSAMPGIAASSDMAGIGFDYRFNMGAPDLWIKMLKDQRDEDWQMGKLWYELTSHRAEEKTINYAESHDQAMVGDKTIIFRLLDKEMYEHMRKSDHNLIVDRGVALHKMIRLITASTNTGGYLNFMGNEFGHPEWIDFPREGNNWSYKYARRQWHLVDDPKLKFSWLNDFDRDMIDLVKKLSGSLKCLLVDEQRKIIAYIRDNYLFVFNFSNTSYTGVDIDAPVGKYHIELTTDDNRYGGFERIDTKMSYPSDGKITLYLPARTATVWRVLK